MVPRTLPGARARPRSAGVPIVDAFGVALKPRYRQFNRCGSPALAARQSRFAQEGRQLCHLAVKQGRAVENLKTSLASTDPGPLPEPLELRPAGPPGPRGHRGPAPGRALALLHAHEEKVPAVKIATAPGKLSLTASPEVVESTTPRRNPLPSAHLEVAATPIHEPFFSSASHYLEAPEAVPQNRRSDCITFPPDLLEDLPNVYLRTVSAPSPMESMSSVSSRVSPKAPEQPSPRGRHLKVEVERLPKSSSPAHRSPRKGLVVSRKEEKEEKEEWPEEVTPKDPKGRSMEPRFANVKRRGRSFTPPKAGALESWRCDHQAVECVIRRRRRKGPKEKLLILPCLATLDDPRFQHLFETLEAEQPDLMSESMLHLSCGARVN